MAAIGNSFFLLADLKKSFPLKPLRYIYRNNQKQELPMAAMFVNGSELNEQSL
jgi:hypothetical protein